MEVGDSVGVEVGDSVAVWRLGIVLVCGGWG